ncbi:GNAT family N-acetyltransferase [Metabacillus sp. KIGAM252]|uniref:GNAT family N-acetyltransferase n=1 Tax=Metabacillus flavus TaxID=2823519 RepID=A0ABS5LG14_9BACI|nr:GNAT family protein [Metabacillus flavus]MBS2969524.1 GNAT family N-acetyltransferase [Metabacillus flavus]
MKQMIDLFTGRTISLTAPRSADIEDMNNWRNSHYLRMVDTDYAFPKVPDAPSKALEFRIRTNEEDQLLGFAALHSIEWNNQCGLLAIGIGEEENRGKGYGAEALQLLLQYAFYELNLNRVGLDVISYNEPAIRAYRKAGFTEEGRLRETVLRDGKAFDRIVMGILRREWIAMQA